MWTLCVRYIHPVWAGCNTVYQRISLIRAPNSNFTHHSAVATDADIMPVSVSQGPASKRRSDTFGASSIVVVDE